MEAIDKLRGFMQEVASRQDGPDPVPEPDHGVDVFAGNERGLFTSRAYLERYAFEVRLVVRAERGLRMAPFGESFLQLTGREAMRWLFTIEKIQSTGFGDPWRMSRRTLTILRAGREHGYVEVPASRPASRPTLAAIEQSGYDYVDFQEARGPIHDRILERLRAWEILLLDRDDPMEKQWIDEEVGEIVCELASEQPGPFEIYARALLADEKRALLPRDSEMAEHLMAEAVARQVRMTAHELRNALVPVQGALEDLWQRLQGSDEALRELRAIIDAGVARTFGFVREITSVVKLAPTPREPFVLVSAIKEAIAALAAGPDTNIMTAYQGDPLAFGHQARFVTAIHEILRNAMQITGDAVQIAITVDDAASADVAILTIDDDGPGVPEEAREAIFANGISYRSGGSGQGLSLAREVIEREMSGRITCEPGPLGGARFTIRLPTYHAGAS